MDPDAFVAEFEANNGAALSEAGVDLEIRGGEDGAVVIEGLRVPGPRRVGRGSEAMSLLCDMADRAGIALLVRPEPIRLLVDDPVSEDGLRRFYARLGFAPRQGDADGLWCRQPKGAAA